MDAITLLKQDHRTVESLFDQFQNAGDDAEKRRIVEKIGMELARHSSVEEQVLYPRAREALDAKKDDVAEALEEHHLAELEKLPTSSERFAAKVRVLAENVRHHVEEEENELFPALEKAVSNQELLDMGETMDKLKAAAPSRAHPFLPDTPPFNLIAGPVAGAADKAVQAGKQAVGRALGAIRGGSGS
jgi:hemerythrin superfamily protein